MGLASAGTGPALSGGRTWPGTPATRCEPAPRSWVGWHVRNRSAAAVGPGAPAIAASRGEPSVAQAARGPCPRTFPAGHCAGKLPAGSGWLRSVPPILPALPWAPSVGVPPLAGIGVPNRLAGRAMRRRATAGRRPQDPCASARHSRATSRAGCRHPSPCRSALPPFPDRARPGRGARFPPAAGYLF